MRSISPSCLHYILLTAVVTLVAATIVHSVTLETDVEFLRLLQRSIDPSTIPKSSFLDTWNFSIDPCEGTAQFLGILCTYPDDESSQRVTAIYLDSAGYDGFIPLSFGNLTQLTTFNLGRNNFRGPIPDSISNLRKLTTVSLSGNFLTGSIPVGLTKLKKLETIDLSYNSLSGSIPTKLSGLRSLTRLSLSHNDLSGRIPDLTGSWQLHTLELDGNQLYGNLPKFPSSLRTLSLGHNSLSGHISSVGKLQNLRFLDLSGNRFTGSISREILTLPQVAHINVSNNHFTELEVIKFSARETHVQDFDAHGNLIRGHLPINLVSMRSLTSINLARNEFSGPIPKQYGAKLGNSWKSLFLDHNFLTGKLPPEFTRDKMKIKGSLANNCLKCPPKVAFCYGRQRPASECLGQNEVPE